ncbi:MAG: glycosyltransferase, partial [Acidimicrobiia bacterium]
MSRGGRPGRERPVLVHLTTTDMSLDWLLGPQLRAFGEAGYEVVGVSATGPHVAALADLGVRHVAVDSLTRSSAVTQDLRAFVDLVRLLRRLRPDILHTHNPKPGILGRIAGRLAGVPLVVNTQHGLYAQPTDRRRRRWPVYVAERVAAAFGHVELVQNEEDVETLVHRLRVPARKVRLLGNGVDLGRFDPGRVPDGTRERVRREWGIGDDEVVVGVVGRLVRE